MSFQLKHQNKVIKTANRPIIGLEIKLIHKDGTHKKIPNSLSPFSVSFDLNKSYANKTFHVNMLNPKTKELVLTESFSIKAKKKREKRQEKKKDEKENKKVKEREFALLFDDLK